jgi:hypothetical protein
VVRAIEAFWLCLVTLPPGPPWARKPA